MLAQAFSKLSSEDDAQPGRVAQAADYRDRFVAAKCARIRKGLRACECERVRARLGRSVASRRGIS
jgi:hypothetical protein